MVTVADVRSAVIAEVMPPSLGKILFLPVLLLFFAVIGCGKGNHSRLPETKDAVSSNVNPAVEFTGNRAEGLERAKMEKKPALLFFGIPDNISSQKMLETAFCNSEVVKLAQAFICIKIDGVAESDYCESLGIRGFPTIVLANSSGSEIQRLTGKQSPELLITQMHVVLQTVALRQNAPVR
jgi:hypothetical protein